jgi:hypothetical protein
LAFDHLLHAFDHAFGLAFSERDCTMLNLGEVSALVLVGNGMPAIIPSTNERTRPRQTPTNGAVIGVRIGGDWLPILGGIPPFLPSTVQCRVIRIRGRSGGLAQDFIPNRIRQWCRQQGASL